VAVTVTLLYQQTAQMLESDLEETAQRGSQGAGGQNANKVNSAIRLRHRPTGLEVMINGRDQWRNRQTARQALAGKIRAWLESQKTRAAYAGAGRGEKVRTYNLADSRITDHRNGAKCHRPDMVLREGRFELLR
jgi:protein subunit release factor A